MKRLERSWVVILLWLASLLMALVVPPARKDIFFSLTYLFGGLLVFSFLWAWLNLHWVRVTRQTRSRRSQVGKYVEERFVVENTGPLPKLWLEVRDQSELPGHRPSRVVNSLPAHRQRSWPVKTHCYRRGRFMLGPVTLYSGDPFGLFVLQQDVNLTGHIVVYPPTFDLPGFAPRIGQLPGGDALRRRTHHVTTNVAGVRDYAPGDSFNRIHWPSTARTGRLIAKEFELDPMADIWLFLDMEKRVHAGSLGDLTLELTTPQLLRVLREEPSIELDPSTEEYAVAITASLAKHFLDRNQSVGLVTYPHRDQRESAQTDRGQRQLGRLLAMLAVTNAEGTIPLSQVLAAETVHFTRDTTAIVITPSTDADWVAAIQHLTSRGIRAIAIVIDAATFAQQEISASDNGRNALTVVDELVTSQIPTYLARYGVPLEIALSEANVQAV